MDDFLASVTSLEPGEKVDLFEIDLNPIGRNIILRWTPSRKDGLTLKWRGEDYVSRPIFVTGLKKSGADKPPEPTLTVSNIDMGGYALLDEYEELLGAKLYRYSTFVHFLDEDLDGNPNPGADGTAAFIPEIWNIEQRSGSDPSVIQWRLSSPLDHRGKQLPGRRAYRDICTRNYRVWDPDIGAFRVSTSKACPYMGSAYFKRDGTATSNPNEDECTYDVNGCALRFAGEDLPTWAFPGLRRVG